LFPLPLMIACATPERGNGTDRALTVGFESAASLGKETKDPLKAIPRAVIWSRSADGILASLERFCTRI
jgi:hypothetical protein